MAESWKQWEGTIVDGKFRLERFLGGSEHSVVFLTESDGRQAAIKFVPAIPQALEFQRTSWERTSRLSHPNLIRLYGTGQCRLGSLDLVYAVMEYAEDSVAQILPNRALSADETREMLEPVVAALTYLHDKGLAHGSVRPTNILAVKEELKLSSDQVRPFGGASLAQDATVYAAPEVPQEGAKAPADSWALGATLVEALTQRPPERSSNGVPVVPANLPAPFLDVVRGCLVESPGQRWSLTQISQAVVQKAPPVKAAVAAASAPVAKSSPVATMPAPEPKPVRSSEPERPALTTPEETSGHRTLVAGISLLLVLVAIYFGFHFFRPSSANPTRSAPTASENSQPSSGVPSASSDSSTPSPAPTAAAPSSPTPATSNAPEPSATPAPTPSSGRVANRVAPNVSASARATITGKVRVRVNLAVDENGKVSDARFITPGPSRYFSSRAMEAARKWTFVPPQANGQPTPSKWVVSFTFTRKGYDSSAEQSSP